MAIATDATSTGDQGTPGTSFSVSHTCTGSDLLLWVGILDDGGSGNITGVTYDSVSMTKIDETQHTGSQFISLWYLINPSTGANDITSTGTSSSSPSIRGSSYTGAQQSGVPDDTATVTAATRTTTTGTVTTVADNAWTLMLGRAGATMSAGSGTTIRVGTGAGPMLFDSNAAITPAGSSSLIFTNSSSTTDAIIVSFAPAVAVTFIPKVIIY